MLTEVRGRGIFVFRELIALGIATGSVYRVSIADGSLTTIHTQGRGPSPDGVVVRDGVVYWTTMGVPNAIRS